MVHKRIRYDAVGEVTMLVCVRQSYLTHVRMSGWLSDFGDCNSPERDYLLHKTEDAK